MVNKDFFNTDDDPEMEFETITDPIERDPKYKDIFERIDSEVWEDLKDNPYKDLFGFCHFFWNRKQEILKEKYNITWNTPPEMNPDEMFD